MFIKTLKIIKYIYKHAHFVSDCWAAYVPLYMEHIAVHCTVSNTILEL